MVSKPHPLRSSELLRQSTTIRSRFPKPNSPATPTISIIDQSEDENIKTLPLRRTHQYSCREEVLSPPTTPTFQISQNQSSELCPFNGGSQNRFLVTPTVEMRVG
ncbi:unnamed protein product [Linum trigynum]|uniref:Uncharacterized protein n=1 Tax=Linum trigynum TaxID=586398 RepID=A0AAV2GMH9_9ROSI